jgi:hypothetical protein
MKLPAPIWLFPRRWRRRYGGEARDVFAASGSRFGDWLDLVAIGARQRLEDSMRTLVVISLLTIAGASLVAAGYALAELEGGVRAMHRHWWSAAPLAAFAASLLLLLLARFAPTSDGAAAR